MSIPETTQAKIVALALAKLLAARVAQNLLKEKNG